MHLLGHHLPDHKLLKVALTSFYGISHATSSLLLSRLSIPLTSRVSDLTETQITSLSAFLSSPSTSPRPGATPLSTPSIPVGAGEAGPSRVDADVAAGPTATATDAGADARRADPLDNLKIETDLRRSMQADIAHQRQVGTYKGRRHALGLPVRGQNTRSNAQTAKKLNRVDRRHYSGASYSASYSEGAVNLFETGHTGFSGGLQSRGTGTGAKAFESRVLEMLASARR